MVSIVTLVLCATGVLVQPLKAAWPRLVMVHGGALESPIVVADWHGIAEAFNDKDRENTNPESRPSFELTLFWGPEWNQYVEDGKPLGQLRPEDARTDIPVPTKGRFYPACPGSSAMIALLGLPSGERSWRVPATGLEAFARAGVPVSVQCQAK